MFVTLLHIDDDATVNAQQNGSSAYNNSSNNHAAANGNGTGNVQNLPSNSASIWHDWALHVSICLMNVKADIKN